MSGERRTYRSWPAPGGWRAVEFVLGESDIRVTCDCSPTGDAEEALRDARLEIETEIIRNPAFLLSMDPVPAGPSAGRTASLMSRLGEEWGVGPMAAVAGAVADEIGARILAAGAGSVIVENGGDIFARVRGPIRFAVYAGEESPFGASPVFEVDASGGVGICTSSGTVGPSISLGRADAVTVLARSAAEADAAATAIGNRIGGAGDVGDVSESARGDERLLGLYAEAGGVASFWGGMRLVGFFRGGVER